MALCEMRIKGLWMGEICGYDTMTIVDVLVGDDGTRSVGRGG